MIHIENKKARSFFLGLFAGSAALISSLVNFLTFDQYPVFRFENLLVAAGLVLVAAIVSIIYADVRTSLRNFLDGILAFVFVDFNTEGLLWPSLAFAIGVVASRLLRGRFLPLMATFTVIICLSSLTGLGQKRPFLSEQAQSVDRFAREGNPGFAVVHVVLDEHVGLAGFPQTVAGDRARLELRRAYLDSGFTIFEKAFARHTNTINALADELNFGEPSDYEKRSTGTHIAPNLGYFNALASMGFKMHVLQSDFYDLCAENPISHCTTYPGVSLTPLLGSELAVADKAGIIASRFLTFSEPIKALSNRWDNFAKRMAWQRGVKLSSSPLRIADAWPISAVSAAQSYTSRLANAEPGNAYFVHLLAPHHPYVMTKDCEIKEPSGWTTLLDSHQLEKLELNYLDQVGCAQRIVEEILLALEQSPAAGRTVLVIQGDHGSRLKVRYLRPFTKARSDAEMRAAYSTFFAVRYPKPRPDVVEVAQPIPFLLQDLVSSKFTNVSTRPTHSDVVWVADSQWRPYERVRLPKSIWSNLPESRQFD